MDERELDARDLVCPLPVLKARKALMGMTPGAVLKVLATDPAAPIDFGVFCETNGHRLLSTEKIDEVIVFRIERAN